MIGMNRKGFFQLLNWTLAIIWIAFGLVLTYIGLPYYLGGFLTFLVVVVWFSIFLYVQIGIFWKLEFDDSDKLILSDDARQSLLVTFGMIVFFVSTGALALSYLTLLSTFIIIVAGIAVIYLFWSKDKK